MKPLQRSYPAALIGRYRARSWAVELSEIRGSRIWVEKVIRPLMEAQEIFTREQPVKFLAAALLVDLLLVADPGRSEVRVWAERLETLLAQMRRSSRQHEESRAENALFREPFADSLERLRSFLRDENESVSELYPTLRELSVQLAY